MCPSVYMPLDSLASGGKFGRACESVHFYVYVCAFLCVCVMYPKEDISSPAGG